MSDEDLKFRDECAIQMMQAILSGTKFSTYSTTIQKIFNNLDPNTTSSSQEYDREQGIKVIRHAARISYIIADEMRKVRVGVFE